MENNIQGYNTAANAGRVYEPYIAIPVKRRIIYRFLKRAMDIVSSLLALIVLVIPMIVIAILIKLDSPGPVIFKQKRAGKDGVPFLVYKFRTMYRDAEERLLKSEAFQNRGNVLFIDKPEDDPRITRLGQALRKTSLDELPQFYNVFLSNMSLVGPRPLAMYEHDALTSYQRQRCQVKPGITCFWQVSGRSNLTEQERVELDLQYIREQSLWTDIKLLFKTVPALIKKTGAY